MLPYTTHCADDSLLMPCMLDTQICCHWHAEGRRAQKIFLQPLEPLMSGTWVDSGMTQQEVDAKDVPCCDACIHLMHLLACWLHSWLGTSVLAWVLLYLCICLHTNAPLHPACRICFLIAVCSKTGVKSAG